MANELDCYSVHMCEVKIKSIAMQTARILQAVTLMLIVALAASCTASKEYSSKLFGPRPEDKKDSQTIALRFLELDKLEGDKDGWVTTDIIMGRDTASKTAALDNLAKTFPAANTKDSAAFGKTVTTIPVVAESKPVPAPEIPIAKNTGEGRTKKTREDNQ